MTTADERRRDGGAHPWHDATPPAVLAAGGRAAIRGSRAGLVTRSLANVADLVLVALVLGVGYLAVAAVGYLLGPTRFAFPAPSPTTLLLAVLGVQAVYFAVTWAVAGGTYGDRLLGLRVTDDRGARLGWARCALRAVTCVLLPVGLLWVLVSAENRSVQDLVLRTSVVYD
ncbi:RDD family protein [Geodermatophilus sp. SYSU D00815]